MMMRALLFLLVVMTVVGFAMTISGPALAEPNGPVTGDFSVPKAQIGAMGPNRSLTKLPNYFSIQQAVVWDRFLAANPCGLSYPGPPPACHGVSEGDQ